MLIKTLERQYPKQKFDFLISMVEKKKGPECFRMIAPLAKTISTAPLQTFRTDDPYYLLSRLRPDKIPLRIYPTAVAACKDLLENSTSTDILVITGSHFLMGEIAAVIKREGF